MFLGGGLLGKWFKDFTDHKNIKKDLYYLDYVERHPELFPPKGLYHPDFQINGRGPKSTHFVTFLAICEK